jgi:hypothetical protein
LQDAQEWIKLSFKKIFFFCIFFPLKDIWQLAEAVFSHAKRQNPVKNRNNSVPTDLLTIPPLMNASQLAQFKEDQRRLQKDTSNSQNPHGATTIAPRQRPNPKRPPSPKEMVNRAESALQVCFIVINILISKSRFFKNKWPISNSNMPSFLPLTAAE